MPESTQSVIEIAIGAVVAVVAMLGFRLREKKTIDDKFGVIHTRTTSLERGLHGFREEVAKTYPSRATMKDEIGSLEKNIKLELRAHTAELKNVLEKEIAKTWRAKDDENKR